MLYYSWQISEPVVIPAVVTPKVVIPRVVVSERYIDLKFLFIDAVSYTWLAFCVVYRIHSKGRDLSNRVYASEEARTCAMERAEELQASLEPQYPSFLKSMLQSHVTGGFWLVSNLVYLPFFFFECYVLLLPPLEQLHWTILTTGPSCALLQDDPSKIRCDNESGRWRGWWVSDSILGPEIWT